MPGTSLLSPRWRMHAAHMRPTVSSGLNMTASKIQRINIINEDMIYVCKIRGRIIAIKLGTVDPNDLGSVDIKVIWSIWLGVEDPIRELVSIWLMLSTLLLFVTPISFDCVGCLEDGQSLLSSSGTSSRFDFRMFLSLIALICKIWRRNAAADAWDSFQPSICAAKSSFREIHSMPQIQHGSCRCFVRTCSSRTRSRQLFEIWWGTRSQLPTWIKLKKSITPFIPLY